jgi:hypothetical protein
MPLAKYLISGRAKAQKNRAAQSGTTGKGI